MCCYDLLSHYDLVVVNLAREADMARVAEIMVLELATPVLVGAAKRSVLEEVGVTIR